MLKLVPKYQKGKTLPTPQQLQQAFPKIKTWPTPQQLEQAIDKKYPHYAWIRDHDLKKPLSNTDPVGAAYVKTIAAGIPIARAALVFSKLIDKYNRTNAQATYRALRNAKVSREQARKYAEVGDPDSWVTAPFSWLIKKYYGIQAKHPIINAILP